MSKKLISVIIPVYNQELFLGRCLRSILSQSINREDFEIIVIDDGSKDGSLKIIQSFGNEIILIKNKKNKGLPYSINRGIKKSSGKYIVRLDSDDYVNKNFLLILKIFLDENLNYDAVSCDYYLVNNKEKFLSRQNCLERSIGCGIMFRAKHLKKIGPYDENFLLHEDKDYRIRFTKKYKINRIPLPLYRYRVHNKNITKNKKKLGKFMKKLKKKHNF